ncbi:hypothetical protein [Dinoroseobacter sp. S124A]|uniref:hypothetical protein n=1 Tax=Dinoroseobacter sp. S124A TaxID=3415128 RepID=UPI003C7AA3C2
MKIDGFVIIGPNGQTGLEYGTFGKTMFEAWAKHCQFAYRSIQDNGEKTAVISRWAQKGWRPVPATMAFDLASTAQQREGEG